MTDEQKKKDGLEERLAALTRWEGGPAAPELWKRAVQAAGEPKRGAGPTWRIAALLAVLVGVGAIALVLQSRNPRFRFVEDPGPLAARRPTVDRSVAAPPAGTAHLFYTHSADGHGAGGPAEAGAPAAAARPPDAAAPPAIMSLDRQVVRKATIELAVADVRIAFERAAMVVSEARGEFVEKSALEGEGPVARASLTLRVDASRLDEVLNELRELGEVKVQESSGEDVTSQVVDTEARLNNERRIEKELLELVESRTEPPLKEVLEVRRSIDEVRGSIERLVAQRERLSRLVSLATVLVIIRAADALPEKPVDDLGRYFGEQVGVAWTGGLRILADTIAGVLRLAVGGLVWWLLLAVAIFGGRAWWRQVQARRATA